MTLVESMYVFFGKKIREMRKSFFSVYVVLVVKKIIERRRKYVSSRYRFAK